MSLVDLTLKAFIDQLSGDTPAPGGGSVAALAGGLSAALCLMVTRLTLGREKYRDVWKDMARVRDAADKHARRLLELVDEDTEAYNQVMAAFRLPKGSDDLKAARKEAIGVANKGAALVPLDTLRTLSQLVDLIGEALEKGNPNCITDAGVAVQLIRAAATGAAYNIRINVSGISDNEFSTETITETKALLDHINIAVNRLESVVEQGL
ncbi:cyclodeaminase/cyclohydrolase family protein [bacterium]|nr:cyclodeaminase/cyclohydrolase family protein [bacterium]